MIEAVGTAEIARRLGVKHRTVTEWLHRSKTGRLPIPMPKPKQIVSGVPIWDWAAVARWAKRTGRLVEQ